MTFLFTLRQLWHPRPGILCLVAFLFSFPNSVCERLSAKLCFACSYRKRMITSRASDEAELRGHAFPNGVWERGVIVFFGLVFFLVTTPSSARADERDPLRQTIGTVPEFSLRDQNPLQGQNNGGSNGQNPQRLVIVEDDTAAASTAGLGYGRSLGASGGVDIRV